MKIIMGNGRINGDSQYAIKDKKDEIPVQQAFTLCAYLLLFFNSEKLFESTLTPQFYSCLQSR